MQISSCLNNEVFYFFTHIMLPLQDQTQIEIEIEIVVSYLKFLKY